MVFVAAIVAAVVMLPVVTEQAAPEVEPEASADTVLVRLVRDLEEQTESPPADPVQPTPVPAGATGALRGLLSQGEALRANMSPRDYVLSIGPAAPEAFPYDPYKPAGYDELVHYEDFTALLAPVRFDVTAIQTGPAPFTNMQIWTFGECTGGAGNSGYNGGNTGGLCRAQDSLDIVGQPSPPWVWEHFNPNGAAGEFIYTLNFADGNGPAAAGGLTRLYLRFSILYEANGVGPGLEDYKWSTDSNKWFQFNDLGQGFLQSWYEQAPVFWEQESPSTEPSCTIGLTSNTWNQFAPGDTAAPQFLGVEGDCTNLGKGGFGKRGIWQHHFVCMDLTPTSGNRILSWGMMSTDEQGIAGYHDGLAGYLNPSATVASDLNSFVWNGTYGGGDKVHEDQSYWWDDLVIYTGDSGSCVNPADL